MNLELTDLVPHRGPMLLLDRIVDNKPEYFATSVLIRTTSTGFTGTGVPGWFGLEYMAQTIGAMNGARSPTPGAPEIGFLVGVRNYQVSLSEFPHGAELKISVRPSVVIGGSGTFECSIHLQENQIASALVTTFKPSAEMLDQMKRSTQ